MYIIEHSLLSKEWNYSKNHEDPKKITHGSSKRVWWKCEKGHEWQAAINNRSCRNSKCPRCSKQKVTSTNCLAVTQPGIMKQWHPTKNGAIDPKTITSWSLKKVWWICEKGHEWKADVAAMTKRNIGCPFCKGKRILVSGDKLISKMWHYSKNGDITDVTPHSAMKVWWVCEKGHEWQARVADITAGIGCPYCHNQRVGIDNNLLFKSPLVASEWHPTKNGTLTPDKVVNSSAKRVWWKCRRGHEWQTRVYSRTIDGSNCPICNQNGISKIELRIYHELKKVFGNVQHGSKIYGCEIDIYMPDFNLGIEYDGAYWHNGKESKDNLKIDRLCEKGIRLIRIRQVPLELLSTFDICHNKNQSIFGLIKSLLNKMEGMSVVNERSKNYQNRKTFMNDVEYNKSVARMPLPNIGNSLLEKFPEIASEWNYEKNGALKPEHTEAKSGAKVWWKCKNNHEWKARIANRTFCKSGCPFCWKEERKRDWHKIFWRHKNSRSSTIIQKKQQQ